MRTPLQKGETILLTTYSSWTSLIIPVFIALAAVAGSYFIGFLPWGWTLALAGVLYFLIRYYSWKVNIWVVTNFRVIDETGLLSHYAKESPLDKINNVSYDQTLIGRLFNYGHVEIQTAAEVGATDYFNVNHPKRLKDTITAAQAEYKMGNNPYVMGLKNAGPGMAMELEKLFELKEKGAISEIEYNKAKQTILNRNS
ncbi:SHOCT domain-containing protein [Flavitalea flava]